MCRRRRHVPGFYQQQGEIGRLDVWGAYEEEKLVGVLAPETAAAISPCSLSTGIITGGAWGAGFLKPF
jgi:hypothetical protein